VIRTFDPRWAPEAGPRADLSPLEKSVVLNKNHTQLSLAQLPDRIMPTVATFSNGLLLVQGDNAGNNISVAADASGNITVTERGAAVTVSGATAATTANVKLVVEQAGTGTNNTLSTAASLGGISDTLIGGGKGNMVFNPLNNAPSIAFGSQNSAAHNYFNDNPGGKDVFFGGAGQNFFNWQPGTGTDQYIGAGKSNTVLVVGNNGGAAENDSLQGDGAGGTVYTRNNLVPFKLFTTGIQNWIIQPSSATGNTVTVGDLSGTSTKSVDVDESKGTVDASGQNDADVKLIVHGKRNTVSEGAGTTTLSNKVAVDKFTDGVTTITYV
jgi:hypothetical protein